MRYLALLLALLLGAPAFAEEAKGITSLRETVELAPDGSAAVTVEVKLANWPADRLDLPLNFGKPGPLAVSGNVKADATVVRNGDARQIHVQFDGKPPVDTTVSIRFTAQDFLDWKKARSPRGVYGLSYTFTNTGMMTIGRYALTVRLPQGYGVNGVTSSTPRMTGEEVEPPYDFGTVDGRTVMNLRAKSIGPGKTAAIAFGFSEEERHPLPFVVAGLLIALVALWGKRDVLTREDYVREASA